MEKKWYGTAHKGLRYFEHDTRKHGKRYDRYYSIRFRIDGKLHTYGVGWLSDGIPEAICKAEPNLGFEDYCLKLLRQYKGNVKTGAGPKSPKEQRNIEQARIDQLEQEKQQAEKEAITFGKFFEDTYIPQAKADKKEKTVEREEGLFNKWIKPAISDLPMKDVTPFHLEKLKRDMKTGELSDRSIEYALSVVRQVFNTAKRLKVFTGENPTNDVKFPKPDNGRMRFLTKEEAEALLNYLKIHSLDVHDITLLSLHCGLRFGEIAALTYQDVDTKQGILTIRDAKAGSRYAFMTEQAIAMMKTRQENRPKKSKLSNFIFKGRKGKLKQISLTFAKAVEALKFNKGIDDPRLHIVFHSCRHSYASWLVEQGQDLYTVQKLLGHKTNVMTQRYSHISENKFRDAAKALSQALQPQQAGQVVNFPK